MALAFANQPEELPRRFKPAPGSAAPAADPGATTAPAGKRFP
jgi:hypothetical protein